jgi:hypothetical protein
MESREPEPKEPTRAGRPEPDQFTLPLLGTLYGSVVVIAVLFVLNTDIGRDVEEKLDAPAMTLIATPLVILAVTVFASCLVALVAPAYRRQSMRVAEIAAWVIPAWAIMAGLVLAAISYALNSLD